MKTSLRILLDHLIDYAGLFPPASLAMQDAVRNYARYRGGEHAWALGKFVVPADRMHEVPSGFPLSILGIDEVKSADLDSVPEGAYVETTGVAMLPELARRHLCAKIRTGGVTADAFPTPETVAAFLRGCKAAGIAFKATAGLHHPLRCVKPLTYEPDAPTGTMHGFVNVFLAAALLDHAEDILRETEASAFAFDDDGASWRGHRVANDDLTSLRATFAHSFGSCSFEEPIADLKALGWL